MESSSDLPNRFFVYGTLKRSQPNYFQMLDRKHGVSQFICKAITETAYPLVISTQWNLPFLLDAPGRGQHIFGEIFGADDRALEWLDGFEGHPEMYVREKITVKLLKNDSYDLKNCENLDKIECWTYLLKKFPNEMLDLETYSSYDAYGEHNKLYKPEEDQLSASNIDESLI